MDTPIKVIRKIRDIPDGEVVTKITGKKEYTISRCLKIYSDEEKGVREIKAEGGHAFLISEPNGNINSYNAGKEVLHHTTIHDLANQLGFELVEYENK